MSDPFDAKIISALVENARLTSQELGEIAHLSPSQAARRRQKLEQDGVIQSYHARVDPHKLGLHVEAFVEVAFEKHTSQQAEAFQKRMLVLQLVQGCWSLSGETDYLLFIRCHDMYELSEFLQKTLIELPYVARVRSHLVMSNLKHQNIDFL